MSTCLQSAIVVMLWGRRADEGRKTKGRKEQLPSRTLMKPQRQISCSRIDSGGLYSGLCLVDYVCGTKGIKPPCLVLRSLGISGFFPNSIRHDVRWMNVHFNQISGRPGNSDILLYVCVNGRRRKYHRWHQ